MAIVAALRSALGTIAFRLCHHTEGGILLNTSTVLIMITLLAGLTAASEIISGLTDLLVFLLPWLTLYIGVWMVARDRNNNFTINGVYLRKIVIVGLLVTGATTALLQYNVLDVKKQFSETDFFD